MNNIYRIKKAVRLKRIRELKHEQYIQNKIVSSEN